MYTIGRFSLQEGTNRLSLIGIAFALFHARAPAIRIIFLRRAQNLARVGDIFPRRAA